MAEQLPDHDLGGNDRAGLAAALLLITRLMRIVSRLLAFRTCFPPTAPSPLWIQDDAQHHCLGKGQVDLIPTGFLCTRHGLPRLVDKRFHFDGCPNMG